jgi:hypothetical protein
MLPPRSSPITTPMLDDSDVPTMITTAYPDIHDSLRFNDTMDFDQDSADSVSSPLHLSHPVDSYTIEEAPSFGSTPSITSSTSSQNVRVNVGGEDYSFPTAAFDRFRGLPWKQDSMGILHLNSSAAVFEVLLDYVLFATLPAYDTLSKDEFEEFETMALGMGGLTTLIEHFDRKDSYLAREVRPRRNYSFNSKKTQGHFLLNGEQSHKSPNSVRATQCARFLGAICGVADSIRRRPGHPRHGDGEANKRLKLGPEESSANSVVS